MWLRMVVGNWIQQNARRHVMDAAAQFTESARPAGAEGELEPSDIVILFALGVEAGGTIDLLEDAQFLRGASFREHRGRLAGQRVSVVETGVGAESASQAAADIIQLYRPQWVISTGFAGGLVPEARRGHIVMANRVVDTDGQQLELGLTVDEQSMAETAWLHAGGLLTVDRLIRSPAEKRQLGEKHRALACDMETMAIATACRQLRTRCLAMRIVSDAVDDELPTEIDTMLRQDSLAGKLGAATGALMSRLGSAKEMWQLREDALKASDRLANFLTGICRQLSESAPADEGSADGPASDTT